MSSETVIEIHDVSKVYGATVTAVDHVSLSVRRGEVYGFVGPNGAGKTTTLRMVLGLIRPTSGQVTVLGRRPGDPAVLERVGSMIEGPAFYPYLSGRANLSVVADYAGASRARIDEALETVDLSARGGHRFSTYSLGMKQRLGVAAALLKDPDLVVLDEPTNGLDPAGIRSMRALIRRLGDSGRTVVLSSHLLGEVQQICDRIGVIADGAMIAEDTVDDLRGRSELVLRATPGHVVRAALTRLDVAVDETTDGELRLHIDDDRTAETIRALVLAGADVTEARRVDRQLEDIFFDMTAKSDAKKESHV